MEVIEDFEGQGRPVVELADDNAAITKQRHFRVPFERLVNLEVLVRKQHQNSHPICLCTKPGEAVVAQPTSSSSGGPKSKAKSWTADEKEMALGTWPGVVSLPF